ncbi:MAG TPA: hypothetical protein VFA18_04160 [Gemmataceae bacterium]|nr:hypothetical protein [Gemmataceae bacterium]
MALKHLESLVLFGVPAVRGVVADVERVDPKQGLGQNPAGLSHPRHLSQGSPDTDYQNPMRFPFAPRMGMAEAVRAGRSGCPTGVSLCRGPALAAGRGKLHGWPRITGGFVPARTWRLTVLAAKRRVAGRLTRSGRSSGQLPRRAQARMAVRGQWANLRLAHGTQRASTRGTTR